MYDKGGSKWLNLSDMDIYSVIMVKMIWRYNKNSIRLSSSANYEGGGYNI